MLELRRHPWSWKVARRWAEIFQRCGLEFSEQQAARPAVLGLSTVCAEPFLTSWIASVTRRGFLGFFSLFSSVRVTEKLFGSLQIKCCRCVAVAVGSSVRVAVLAQLLAALPVVGNLQQKLTVQVVRLTSPWCYFCFVRHVTWNHQMLWKCRAVSVFSDRIQIMPQNRSSVSPQPILLHRGPAPSTGWNSWNYPWWWS